MLEYWLQNGESVLENGSRPLDKKELKRILQPTFQKNGKFTKFSQTFFRHLLCTDLDDLLGKIGKSLEKERWNPKVNCSLCGVSGAAKMKGWVFPFVISKDKFPNLYPNGRVETLTICKNCTEKSIAAYKRVKFSAQKDYLSFVLFFSNDSKDLKKFYDSIQEMVIPQFFRNWTDKQPDIIYYPHEFLAYLLYNIATIKVEQKYLSRRLGALIFGLSTGSKKIYDNVNILDDLAPLISVFMEVHTRNHNAFPFLFRRLREEGNDVNPGMFIKRNYFFRRLFIYKTIDWTVLEDILFYNVANNRNIPFINMFLLTLMGELHMSEKEVYEHVSKEGYDVGKELLRAEGNDRDKAKTSLYELRRKRRMEEFLDVLNLIQIKTGKPLDDRPFKENPEAFNRLKTFFLIGMTNAIFRQEKGGER